VPQTANAAAVALYVTDRAGVYRTEFFAAVS